jgi:hypothetical protein
VNQCTFPPSATGGPQNKTCGVPTGFVLVGGGGEIEGTNAPGALLTGSYPSFGTIPEQWVVSAKDHEVAHNYRLRAAAIGLRLNGVSETSLRSMRKQTKLTSSAGSNPRASISTVPANHIQLGGGACTSGSLHLLTASYPDSIVVSTSAGQKRIPSGWIASSKDHMVAQSATVTALMVSIPRCPTGYTGGCLLTEAPVPTTSSSGGGYSEVTVEVSGPATGIGARANWFADGRLLTDILPTDLFSGVRVYANSKDHESPDSGSTTVYVIKIRQLN